MKQRVLLLVVILILSLCSQLMAEKMIVRIDQPDMKTATYFQTMNYDIASYVPNKYIDLVVDEQEYQILKDKGYNPVVHTTENELKANLTSKIAGYRSYEDVYNELQEKEILFSDYCRLYNIGTTWGKIYADQGYTAYNNYQHDIWALKVTDNPDVNEDEPKIYIFGAHHARELISTEVAMGVLNNLLENYNSDPTILNILNNAEIWFVPIVNPNGHEVANNSLDVWWRKNLRDNNDNQSLNIGNYSIDGVDLNRNYAWEWGLVGASDNFEDETYHGPNPISEPELVALDSLMAANRFALGISYHSYSELVLYPFGYALNVLSPDDAAMGQLATDMANTITGQNGGHYTPQPSYALYPCMGSLDDYSYGKYSTFCYTIELATQFIPNGNQVAGIVENNIQASEILFNRLFKSTLSGHIKDSNGLPIVAEVYVLGVDNTGVHKDPFTTEPQFGRYDKMLQPGTYTVQYRKFGYQTVTVENIVISSDSVTHQEIILVPAETLNLTGTVYEWPLTNVLPNARVIFVNTPYDTVFTDAQGQFVIENIPQGEYTVSIDCEGYGLYKKTVNITSSSFEFYLAPVYSTEDFESNFNWITTGMWGRSVNYSYSPTHSLADSPTGFYQDNYQSTAKYPGPLSLAGDTWSVSVSFMTKLDLESGYDYCYFEVSTDNSTWDVIDTFTGTSDWLKRNYNLDNYLEDSSLNFRFRFYSDQGVTQDGIFIDDFKIYVGFGVPNNDIVTQPAPFVLKGNYPNPFNPSTTIEMYNNVLKNTNISIYNVKGELVKTLHNGMLSIGKHQFNWEGKDNSAKKVSSGIYFYQVRNADSIQSRKMVLIK